MHAHRCLPLRLPRAGATPVDTAAFLRPGGMHRRYYSLADVDRLAAAAGLEVVESRYLCVRLTNQRRGVHMDRVYVHAVLRRPVGHSRRLLHANSRLRIFDERLGPDCTASVHHAVPAVWWQVLDASQPTPSPSFHAAGFTATVRNVSPHERRDICFEVLGEPLHGEEEVARRLAAPRWPTAPGQRLLLENALVRMWDFRASLGMDRLAFHQHVFDNAWVVLGDGAALRGGPPARLVPSQRRGASRRGSQRLHAGRRRRRQAREDGAFSRRLRLVDGRAERRIRRRRRAARAHVLAQRRQRSSVRRVSRVFDRAEVAIRSSNLTCLLLLTPSSDAIGESFCNLSFCSRGVLTFVLSAHAKISLETTRGRAALTPSLTLITVVACAVLVSYHPTVEKRGLQGSHLNLSQTSA